MENQEKLLDRFKSAYPELQSYHPDIYVCEPVGNDLKPNCTPYIEVRHPFVFDVRLIPETFENISVKHYTNEEIIKEFPNSQFSLPWYEIFSPENYIKFVNNNIESLRSKLGKPHWSEQDILDALTGSFKNYKQKCIDAKLEMEVAHREEIAFFNSLLIETEQAYSNSNIYRTDLVKKGQYSVLATSIFKGSPLILGFNWGAAKALTYSKQTEYPFRMFSSSPYDLGSLKRTLPYFEKYYPEALHGMQSNYCFFRSEKENQITANDLKLSQKLINQLISYSQPSSIISFSSKLRDYFLANHFIDNVKTTKLDYKDRNVIAIQGTFNQIIGKEIQFYYLPHPMAQISNEIRKQLWEFCFSIK